MSARDCLGDRAGEGLSLLLSQPFSAITQGGPSSKRFYITPCPLVFIQQTFPLGPVLGDSAANKLNQRSVSALTAALICPQREADCPGHRVVPLLP